MSQSGGVVPTGRPALSESPQQSTRVVPRDINPTSVGGSVVPTAASRQNSLSRAAMLRAKLDGEYAPASSRSSSSDLRRPLEQLEGGSAGGVVPRGQRDNVMESRDDRDNTHDDDGTPLPTAPTGPGVTTADNDANAEAMDEEIRDYIGDDYHYTNFWFTFRDRMKPYFAEFLGTLILVLWGEGTQAQVLAARNAPDDYLSIAFGWGVGFMIAVYVSSGISGGHINPAVTISMAIFRKFPRRKVPGYILAQMLGAFCGAGILFGVYKGTLAGLPDYDISVGKIFTTGPAAKVPSLAETFFSVFIGAALLLLSIAAFTDTGNNTAAPGLTPLLLGFVMLGIATAFGYQTGFVLNPARDMGPRLLVWAVTGISAKTLWLDVQAYGIWLPWVGTVTGGIAGMFFYDILIYTGRDSPINFNYSRRYRKAKRAYKKAHKESRLSNILPGRHGRDHRDEEAGLGHRVSSTSTVAALPPPVHAKTADGVPVSKMQ